MLTRQELTVAQKLDGKVYENPTICRVNALSSHSHPSAQFDTLVISESASAPTIHNPSIIIQNTHSSPDYPTLPLSILSYLPHFQ